MGGSNPGEQEAQVEDLVRIEPEREGSALPQDQIYLTEEGRRHDQGCDGNICQSETDEEVVGYGLKSTEEDDGEDNESVTHQRHHNQADHEHHFRSA